MDPAATPPAGRPVFGRLLLTGAAGTLGRAMMPALQGLAQHFRVSDLPGPLARISAPAAAEVAPCDLANPEAVMALMRGVDAVVHLGGISVEGPFDPILQSNILGAHNLYEAVRRQGVKRVVLASSNHVTGCYERAQRIDPRDPARPDGNYGLSKLFGEGLASLYWDRYGIESVCLRIGSATPAPPDLRGLSTWISLPDLARLLSCSLQAPGIGFLVAYGMSANTRAFWDTQTAWQRLGFVPQDNAETFAPHVERLQLPAGPQRQLQGGSFLAMGPYNHEDPG